jgi:phosphoribosyl-ATP pyrophosphohydrolase
MKGRKRKKSNKRKKPKPLQVLFERILEHIRSGKKSRLMEEFLRGADQCAKKLGEEVIEAVIALMKGLKKEATNEAGQVLYHLLVGLAARNIQYADAQSAAWEAFRTASRKSQRKKYVRHK